MTNIIDFQKAKQNRIDFELWLDHISEELALKCEDQMEQYLETDHEDRKDEMLPLIWRINLTS